MQKTFIIDSHRRTFGTHSEFTYKIDLSAFNDKENLRVCVAKCNVPRSYYLVRTGLNIVTLVENGHNISLTITPGNYTSVTFRTYLQNLLNASTQNGYSYGVTKNDSTGKYSYTSTGVSSFIFPTTAGSAIHEQFGFNAGDTATLPCTSSNVLKFVSEDTVVIYSDISSDAKSALLSINAAGVPDFGTIGYNCPDAMLNSRPLSTTASDTYKFKLCDPDGNPLDTNGLPCFIELVVWRPPDQVMLDIFNEVLPTLVQRLDTMAKALTKEKK